jgi:hypothetical protein
MTDTTPTTDRADGDDPYGERTNAELVEHHARISVDVTARGYELATAAEVANGAGQLIIDAIEAYEPVQAGAHLWATSPEHPAGTPVGRLSTVDRTTARPTDGPPPALTEQLRTYCREFAIATDDQAAHIDYLNGLILDLLADVEASR